MSTFDYDLFVIGAGSGGVRAARISSQYGARVGIAEEYRYGGTCVIRGCVPKKLMVYASRFPHEFEVAKGYGWSFGETHFSWADFLARKDSEIARLEGIYKTNLQKAGVTIHDTRAEIAGPHRVRLVAEDREVTAERILIATGGTANVHHELPGVEHAITSNEAFHLDDVPGSVVVAGGGYIAVEFASIFAGLGAKTTLVYRGEKILRGFDEDVRDLVTNQLAANGVEVITGTVFTGLEKHEAGIDVSLANGKTLTKDVVMFAIGRSPNSHGLGLENVGVQTKENGAIIVDGFSKTTADGIWAVGDVTDRINLTPVAIREGHAFADTEFGGKPTQADHMTVATAVFTTPEIGTVGLTEDEARAQCGDIGVYSTSFRAMKHAFADINERMLMKVIVDAATDRVVGVHLAGDAAGEMIQMVGIAVKMGATKADFDATVAVHPTAAEELVTLREPTQQFRKAAE
ncbi:MAG: glutathione-disulfide reductase [Pseudomonadota bacterium]